MKEHILMATPTPPMLPLGQNVQVSLEKDATELIIRIDLTARMGRSASGKSTIIATTSGNKPVPAHPGILLGLNCYIKE
jgi:hypothetical protein